MNHLNYVLLIDDDDDDNYFHERAIKKVDSSIEVVIKNSAKSALQHIEEKSNENNLPGLIFLDINMPGMNGWEFLAQYSKFDESVHSKTIIIMLTTSDDLKDKAKAKEWAFVSDFINKPLNKQQLEDILATYFS